MAALCEARKGEYFTPAQYTVAAFRTFEAFSCDPLKLIDYSTVLSPREKKAVPPAALRAVLDELVSINLLTFPSVSSPELIEFPCRALYHAWKNVRMKPVLQEAVGAARGELMPGTNKLLAFCALPSSL